MDASSIALNVCWRCIQSQLPGLSTPLLAGGRALRGHAAPDHADTSASKQEGIWSMTPGFN